MRGIRLYGFLFSSLFLGSFIQAQDELPQPIENSVAVQEQDSVYLEKKNTAAADKALVSNDEIDVLSPAKAAFYSAILPGLGQAYNGKYWKIPIIYAALGTGMYFYLDNNQEYQRYRDAFKRRLAGFDDDEFNGQNGNLLLTDDALQRAQETLQKNRDLALVITIALYALNIIDANVDAHLLQYNINENLSLKPHYELRDIENNRSNWGLTMHVHF